MTSPASASRTYCHQEYTEITAAGRSVFAARPITGTTPLCTSTPSGTPTIPASRPISVTEHTTIAMACRGVMPTDLNTVGAGGCETRAARGAARRTCTIRPDHNDGASMLLAPQRWSFVVVPPGTLRPKCVVWLLGRSG